MNFKDPTDCTGCPAWAEFLESTRDYPCDGCKYARPSFEGDFDPFAGEVEAENIGGEV